MKINPWQQFLIVAVVAITFMAIMALPRPSYAAKCECGLIIEGTGCNVNQTVTFSEGETISLSKIFNQVSAFDCPVKMIIPSDFSNKTYTVPTGACAFIESGVEQEYKYSLVCSAVADAQGGSASPPADGTSSGGSSGSGDGSSGSSGASAAPDTGAGALGEWAKQKYGMPKDYQGPLPDCAFSGTCRNVNDLLELLIKQGKNIFGFIGIVALAAFVYGGFTMLFSFGNAEKTKKGRDILIAAVVGLAIAFSAYLLVNFLLDALGVVNPDFRAIK